MQLISGTGFNPSFFRSLESSRYYKIDNWRSLYKVFCNESSYSDSENPGREWQYMSFFKSLLQKAFIALYCLTSRLNAAVIAIIVLNVCAASITA